MKPNAFLKALLIFLGLIFLVTGFMYFAADPVSYDSFSTTYQDFPDPLPVPTDEPNDVVEVPGFIQSFDISKDRKLIAIATTKELILYDLKTLKELHSIPLNEQVFQVQFSPDGRKLAASGIDMQFVESSPLYITVWDTDSWDIHYEYKSDTQGYIPSGALAWAPDSTQLAFSIPERGLTVMDVDTGKPVAALEDFLVYPFDLSWSPEGQRLISTGDLGYGLRRWRVDTDKWVRLFDTRPQPAMQVKWSPDGTQIASGHFGGTVCVWNVGNNQCEGYIRAHFNSVDALDWSPNSSQFATASGAIRVWDSTNGNLSSSFGFYDGIIYTKLKWFDPQTITTLETSYTKQLPSMIRFWDASTGDVKLAFRGWDNVLGLNNGGVILKLDDVQISSDRTVIQVSLRFNTPDISMAGDWNLTMTDSEGNIYPLINITPPDMDASVARVYQTSPVQTGQRLILDLNSFPQNGQMPLLMDISATPGQFTFNPTALQVGESIALDEMIDANGYTLHLTEAQKVSDTELIFTFDRDGYLNGAVLSAPSASGSSSGFLKNGTFTASLSFAEFPNKPFEVYLTGIYYNAFSPWSLEFQVMDSMFTDLPAVASATPPAEVAVPTFTSQDPLFLEVQSLSQKFNEAITQEAGWIHLVSATDTETMQEGQIYPPAYYQDEQWIEIDSEGWVTRSLTTQTDRARNILQQSISVGTHTMNLTTSEAMEFPAYHLSLDWILVDLDYALTNDQVVQHEEIPCADDSPCLLISMSDGAIVRRVWINVDTGQQVKIQTSQQMSDGTEKILYTQDFLSVERADNPPQDVLELFSKVLFPAP